MANFAPLLARLAQRGIQPNTNAQPENGSEKR